MKKEGGRMKEEGGEGRRREEKGGGRREEGGERVKGRGKKKEGGGLVSMQPNLVQVSLVLLGFLWGALGISQQPLNVVGKKVVCTVAVSRLYILHHEV